jgi:hypothetical protein
MSVDCQASYFQQDPLFWGQKVQIEEHASKHEVIPTAPPMDGWDLITWFLFGQLRYNWSHDEIGNITKLWRQITGFEMSATLSSDCDIPELIRVLQFREAELLRMYSNFCGDETKISRPKMMELHTKFFDDYKCRITDFRNNLSFLFIVETHIQSQFV